MKVNNYDNLEYIYKFEDDKKDDNKVGDKHKMIWIRMLF